MIPQEIIDKEKKRRDIPLKLDINSYNNPNCNYDNISLSKFKELENNFYQVQRGRTLVHMTAIRIALQSLVRSKYEQGLISLPDKLEKRIQEEHKDRGSIQAFDLFGSAGYQNYSYIFDNSMFAAYDCIHMAQLERDLVLESSDNFWEDMIRKDISSEFQEKRWQEIRASESFNEAHRWLKYYFKSFIANIYTTVDNTYQLANNCLEFKVENNSSFNRELKKALNKSNYTDLREVFSNNFGYHKEFRDFIYLRNKATHCAPRHKISFIPITVFNNPYEKIRPSIHYIKNGRGVGEPLSFYYQFLYSHVVNSVYKAIDIMVNHRLAKLK